MNAEDMALLRLQPGDILVVQFPDRGSEASVNALDTKITEMLRKAGHTQVEVLILCGGASVQIMRATADEPEELEVTQRQNFIGRLIGGLKRRTNQ